MKIKIIPFLLTVFIALFIVVTVDAQNSSIVRLSLDQVTDIALQNNFEIQLSKYDAWIKQTDEMEAKSIYDTVLNAELKYRKDESAQSTTFFGTKTVENDYNFGVTKKLPTGTLLGANMTNERESTNSTFTTSPLIHDSTLELKVEQALGKNFLGIQDRGSIQLTLLDIENSEYTTLAKIEQTIAEVQQAYWDLVLHQERVDIDKDMAEQAKKLYDLQQQKLEDGLVEIPDAIASDANYKKARNRLKLSQNTYRRKVNVLKLLLNKSDTDLIIEPSEKLAISKRQLASISSLEKAFKNRRDYKQMLNEVESKDIVLSMSHNNLWPEINLTASLARNGMGDHFSDSAKAISEESNPNFFAGVTFVVPFENRKAKAQLKAAELQKARILLDAKFLERKISIDIMDQVRDCNVLAEVALNELAIADLQIQKLAEELKRFNKGRSETDTIIRFQEDVIQARWAAAQAKFEYQISVIQLLHKEATLLTQYWNEQL